MNDKMKFGIVGSPQTFIEPVRKGWDYLEVNIQHFFLPNEDLDSFLQVKKQVDNAGIATPAGCCFLPKSIPAVGPQRDMEKILQWGETVFQRAAMTQTTRIVFGSGAARTRPENISLEEGREQFLEVLQALAPLAHNHGVVIVIEPLNRGECNLINSLADGAQLVQACNHPAVQLLADFYHMALEDEPASEIEKYGAMIKHVHLAEKEGRTPLGFHGEDFTAYFRALRTIGYAERVSLECKWSDFDRQAPIALATMQQQWEQSAK